MKKATLQFLLISMVALALFSIISLRARSEGKPNHLTCSAPPVHTETPMLWDLLTSRFSAALFLP